MQVEYEATFADIDKAEVRQRLQSAGAILLRPEYLQRRITFNPPLGCQIERSWARVRDEGDRVTVSFKSLTGDKITDQKEIMIQVDDYHRAEALLLALGCQRKAYHENKRELWQLDDAEITIDEWPFLEPFVEIEGASESAVKTAAEKLGFDYDQALFCTVATLYNRKYGVSTRLVNHELPLIVFNQANPFL